MAEDLPSFFSSFIQKKADDPESVVQPPPVHKGPSFTIRDWEMLTLLEHMDDPEPSNGRIGKVLGMTNGAVSARIKRLSEMGLLQVQHFNATDTGVNNRRVLRIRAVPPKPWSPK